MAKRQSAYRRPQMASEPVEPALPEDVADVVVAALTDALVAELREEVTETVGSSPRPVRAERTVGCRGGVR